MVTTIILALAVLTAALVVGVFIIALMELNEIDEILDGARNPQGNSILGPVPESEPSV
jgi:hypothetical protein